MKIGISGNLGSFSEEAAKHYCNLQDIKKYQIEYLISVDNVLRSLKNDKIDKGIFPIENSNGGIVYEAVYAMAKYTFDIEEMFDIDVRHCLLALPRKKISEIKTIASHDQALKQCKMYLKRNWPETELKEWSDTAEAAKDLKNGKFSIDTAVIAPKVCAEIYGLDVLEEGIQDLKFNFTTFIVAKKRS